MKIYVPAQYSDIVSDGGLDPRNKLDVPAHQCKWPTCQSEEYQQALAQEVERELVGEQPSQQEPFGYFKAEPFGWTDCAETDEGAVALYEHPSAQDLERFAELIRADERARVTNVLLEMHDKAASLHNYYKHAALEINRK